MGHYFILDDQTPRVENNTGAELRSSRRDILISDQRSFLVLLKTVRMFPNEDERHQFFEMHGSCRRTPHPSAGSCNK